ncbi:MAG: hypothetical protein NTU62_05365 [Spirochaetes bacterium]|nr:hypothetical protein [Spirochaetota bacterium]
MNKTLTGILGAAQGLFGILGTATGGVTDAVGTAPAGNIFNIVSGAAMGFLGFGTPEKTQKVGVPIIAALNAIMGVLGFAGVQNIGSLNLNTGTGAGANFINIGVAVLGFIFTFLKSKKS